MDMQEGTMSVIAGKQARSYYEAADLALREAGAGDMSRDVLDLFAWAVSGDDLGGIVGTTIARTVRARYGTRAEWWEAQRWLVPVPRLRYDRVPSPFLTFQVAIYGVACVEVQSGGRLYRATIVEHLGKMHTATLPLSFLLALIEEDWGRFRVIQVEGSWITWEVPGMKKPEVRLHESFVIGVSRALERKPVDRWLEEFGVQSQGLIPLVVADLMTLVMAGQDERPLAAQPGYSHELLRAALSELGYTGKEVERMIEAAAPCLKASDPLEETLRKVLQQADRGGK
jgi:hypothetical protein